MAEFSNNGNVITTSISEYTRTSKNMTSYNLDKVKAAEEADARFRAIQDQATQQSVTQQGVNSYKHTYERFNVLSDYQNSVMETRRQENLNMEYKGHSINELAKLQEQNFLNQYNPIKNNQGNYVFDNDKVTQQWNSLHSATTHLQNIAEGGVSHNDSKAFYNSKEFVKQWDTINKETNTLTGLNGGRFKGASIENTAQSHVVLDVGKSKYGRLDEQRGHLAERFNTNSRNELSIMNNHMDKMFNILTVDGSKEAIALREHITGGIDKAALKEKDFANNFRNQYESAKQLTTLTLAGSGTFDETELKNNPLLAYIAAGKTENEKMVRLAALEDIGVMVNRAEVAAFEHNKSFGRRMIEGMTEGSYTGQTTQRLMRMASSPRRAIKQARMVTNAASKLSEHSINQAQAKLLRKQESLKNKSQMNLNRVNRSRSQLRNEKRLTNIEKKLAKQSDKLTRLQANNQKIDSRLTKALERLSPQGRLKQRLTELKTSKVGVTTRHAQEVVTGTVKDVSKKATKKVVGDKAYNKMGKAGRKLLNFREMLYRKIITTDGLVGKVFGKITDIKQVINKIIDKVVEKFAYPILLFLLKLALICVIVSSVCSLAAAICTPSLWFSILYDDSEEESSKLYGIEGKNAEWTYNYLIKFLDKHGVKDNTQKRLIAAAIMGNLMQESNFSPFVINDESEQGEHLGIAQWSEERLEKYVEWCEENNYTYLTDETTYEDDDEEIGIDDNNTDSEKYNNMQLKYQVEFLCYELETSHLYVLNNMKIISGLGEGAHKAIDTSKGSEPPNLEGLVKYDGVSIITNDNHSLLKYLTDIFLLQFEAPCNKGDSKHQEELSKRYKYALAVMDQPYAKEPKGILDFFTNPPPFNNKVVTMCIMEYECGHIKEDYEIKDPNQFYFLPQEEPIKTNRELDIKSVERCDDCEYEYHNPPQSVTDKLQ